MAIKKVSVIIPTYNEEKDIGECLKNLEEQTYKNFEVIIVDDGSTDKTVEIVKTFKKVKLILGEHKGPGASRNLGSKKARGKILIFIDADMTFDKNYLKNLIKPILDDKTDKIVGTTHDYELVKNLDNDWSRCWGKVRVDYRNLKDKNGRSNEAVIFRAIKKSEFLKMGGFNPKYGYADDQTFFIERKIRPYIAKNTTCHHRNPETLKATFKQARWIGASWKQRYLLFRIPILNYIAVLGLFLLLPFMIILKSTTMKIKTKFSCTKLIKYYSYKFMGYSIGVFRAVYFERVWK